jgi:lon-related putative ATP-dependent protease
MSDDPLPAISGNLAIMEPDMPTEPLPHERLTVTFDPVDLETVSRKPAPPSGLILGQERAMEAVTLGAAMTAPGYNLFVMGPEGTGRQSAMLRFLNQRAQDEPTPPDWVYVHDFDRHHQPTAMRLPAGRGRKLAEAMEAFVKDVREGVPALFESEENQNRLRAIEEEFRAKPEEAFEALRGKAAAKSIALIRTPMGFGFAPMADGEIIKPEVFNRMAESERKQTQEEIEKLQKELQSVVRQIPRWERERRAAIHELQSEITALGVGASLEVVLEHFADLPEILEYLEAVRQDLVQNFQAIQAAEKAAAQSQGPGGLEGTLEVGGSFERYKVNPVVSHEDGKGAPVVVEDNPTAFNLIGRVEHISRFGALVTGFSLIRAGALHRANGGYLVIDARKLLLLPFAWDALKRALKAGAVAIEAPAESFGLIATVSLKPEPIPIDTKVALIGERLLFYLLSEFDPEFADLFKVVADFETETERSTETETDFAQDVVALARQRELLPFDASAVSEVLRRAVRLAGDRTKLSIHKRSLVDLMTEADYAARQETARSVTDTHVKAAVAAQIRRLARLRDKDLEAIDRDIVVIETEGRALGQVNGLSVLQLGGFAFGRPSRITARVRMGSGKVIDIEREVKLGGPLHSKGVLILSGFLAGRYAIDRPLSLSATLVFEQSYGGVDGDSASSAELYAIISALSGVTLRQDLAVTGSVDQVGRVQAIGGVNEKIEGFFDVCAKRGLTGTQGVLIPKANVDHLVLREDVVAAAEAGQFFVYPIETIDEGIALLTGREAGERDTKDAYPEESVNGLVEARLTTFAAARQAFGTGDGESAENKEARSS